MLHFWPWMQSASFAHSPRRCPSAPQTSGDEQLLLVLQAVSTGNSHTALPLVSLTQLSPVGQSLLVVHAEWQRPNVQSSVLAQSLLTVQPSPSAVVCSNADQGPQSRWRCGVHDAIHVAHGQTK